MNVWDAKRLRAALARRSEGRRLLGPERIYLPCLRRRRTSALVAWQCNVAEDGGPSRSASGESYGQRTCVPREPFMTVCNRPGECGSSGTVAVALAAVRGSRVKRAIPPRPAGDFDLEKRAAAYSHPHSHSRSIGSTKPSTRKLP